jgi:hypothetical protein
MHKHTEPAYQDKDACCNQAQTQAGVMGAIGQMSSLKSRLQVEIYDLQKRLSLANEALDALTADPGIEATLRVADLLQQLNIR